MCPTQTLVENHIKAIHTEASLKHTSEREPSLNKAKNKKYNRSDKTKITIEPKTIILKSAQRR